ncbi:MAG: DUF1214 domain-containing protein [Microbacteriaceae bacterium]|nr:DUF1214 domain-containing protein [Microbacteriaceae bacterium]MCL2793839.1 DUF1214 domain-containing protein [Microbacteriaceae bacterium]
MGSGLGWVAHSGIVQGVIIGGVFAFLTATLVLNLVARSQTVTVNGWSSVPRVGQPGLGILTRSALAKALPAVNVFEEAAYWTATKDAAGRPLRGDRSYVLRFPPGQQPPNGAFWSLSATDLVGYMVRNDAGRSTVDDRAPLVANADGSVDIRLQRTAPDGPAQNWLPTPAGPFKLMLRAYLPGATVVDGGYRVPAVEEVRA